MTYSPVDGAHATAFLRARYGADATAPRALRHGEWSTAYAFAAGGTALVARFSALEEDFAKDRLASRLASDALPVPRVLEVGKALGGWYAISERAPGVHIDDLDGAGMRRVLPSLFAAIDAERRADLAGTSGYGVWNAHGRAPHATWRAALLDAARDSPDRRVHGWRSALEASATGTAPFDRAAAQLRRLVEAVPEERHLVHSDLLHWNVLVADGRVSAVLDWGSSLYGDFLYDVAWLCFWAPWSPAWRDIDFAAEAAAYWRAAGVSLANFEERLRCYQVHIGLDGQAYNAFVGRFDDVAAIAERTLAVAEETAR